LSSKPLLAGSSLGIPQRRRSNRYACRVTRRVAAKDERFDRRLDPAAFCPWGKFRTPCEKTHSHAL